MKRWVYGVALFGCVICILWVQVSWSPVTVVPIPMSKEFAGDWYMHRFMATNERLSAGNVDLLFVGDSMMMGWEFEGKDIWHKYYGARKAVNLGFGEDRTQNVLWRLYNAHFDNISPKLAIVLIGANNLGVDTPEDTAEGIKSICRYLRMRFPKMKLLLLAIFPRLDETRESSERASKLASVIADGWWIHYMDLREHLMQGNNILSTDIFPDGRHLSREGYQLWAEAIEDKVIELYDDSKSK